MSTHVSKLVNLWPEYPVSTFCNMYRFNVCDSLSWSFLLVDLTIVRAGAVIETEPD